MNRIIVVALTMVLALTLSACGSESTDSAAHGHSSETEALQKRIDELEAENRPEEHEAKREQRRRERQAAVAEPDEEPASGGGGDIIVPDVTGLDHQAAQDALQGEGLWLLDEEDATGQGRLLLWDRNWEVVRTDPPAETAVSEDTSITIYSKKQGE